jgi:hypothetical protein
LNPATTSIATFLAPASIVIQLGTIGSPAQLKLDVASHKTAAISNLGT